MGKFRARALAGSCIIFLGWGTSSLQAGTLFQQPTNNFGGFYSQNDTNSGGLGNYATAFDDFTLGSTATIGSLSWFGSYVGAPGTITGFTIGIWADNSGAPNLGSLLYSTTIGGNAGETFVETDLLGNPEYSYSGNINFTATGGTKYWLSIVANLGVPPQWAWESGSGGDGVSYQDFFGSLNKLSVDNAFTLSTASVPEPDDAALVAGGLVLLGLAKRRLNKRLGS
jgi:hypothetical protein